MQCCNYAIKIGQLGFPLNNVIKLNDAKKKKKKNCYDYNEYAKR